LTKSRVIRCFLCIALLFTVFGGLVINGVLAQGEGDLEVTTEFPVLKGKSGDSFEYTVSVMWRGTEAKEFNLTTETPPNWQATITRAYPESEVAAVRLEAFRDYPEKFEVNFFPVAWRRPEPGEYVATLNIIADDGTVQESIDLKAIVTAIYGFRLVTSSGRLDIEAVAGEDNVLSLAVANSGTAAIKDITFSSTSQQDWSVTFSPSKIDSLEPGSVQEVTVIIKPPRTGAIAGDYNILLSANSEDYTPDSLRIRVTVLTPGMWGWISIIIVVVVIAGLGVLFWRLGRR